MNTIFEEMFKIKNEYKKEYKEFLTQFEQLINMEENLQVISEIIETYHNNLQELNEYF